MNDKSVREIDLQILISKGYIGIEQYDGAFG